MSQIYQAVNPFFAYKAIIMLDVMLVSVDLIFSKIDPTCGGICYS